MIPGFVPSTKSAYDLSCTMELPTPASSTLRVRLLLVLITTTALALRVGWLWYLARPEDIAVDPDGYWRAARLLLRTGEWRWTFGAVRYPYLGHEYLLPPLYPAFLSLFQRQDLALVVQAMLSAACCPLLFITARRVHSERAGLIAATIWAIWAPSIVGTMVFMQEALHIPLLVAGFAALPPLTQTTSAFRFLVAGVLLGCAALARSMPLYFMPVASAFLFWIRRPARAAAAYVIALLGGFLIAAGPYSLSASLKNARVVLIENHGGITAGEVRGRQSGWRQSGGVGRHPDVPGRCVRVTRPICGDVVAVCTQSGVRVGWTFDRDVRVGVYTTDRTARKARVPLLDRLPVHQLSRPRAVRSGARQAFGRCCRCSGSGCSAPSS